jgi:hypothetical protein
MLVQSGSLSLEIWLSGGCRLKAFRRLSRVASINQTYNLGLDFRTMSDAAMRCKARCDVMRRYLSRQAPSFTNQTECLMCKIIQTAVSTCTVLVTLFLAAPSFAANNPHSSTTTSATESTGPPIAPAFPAKGCTRPPMPPTFPATGYTHIPAPPRYRDHNGCSRHRYHAGAGARQPTR